MSELNLLPCNFCGGFNLDVESYEVASDNFHSAYVECRDCEARGPNALTVDGWLPSKDEACAEAIAAWNRRATQPASAPADDRYCMDHGVLHDRVTGQHMWTQDQYDENMRTWYAAGYEDKAAGLPPTFKVDAAAVGAPQPGHLDGPKPPIETAETRMDAHSQGGPNPACCGGAQGQAEPVAVKVDRNRVWLVRGVQSFMLAYEADTAEELNWYADQLRSAIGIFTPCVKLDIQAAPAQPTQAEPVAGEINSYCNDLLDCVAALNFVGTGEIQAEMRATVGRIREAIYAPAQPTQADLALRLAQGQPTQVAPKCKICPKPTPYGPATCYECTALLVEAQPTQAVERDAARYRWLREHSYVEFECASPRVADWMPLALDERIDLSIASMTKET